MLEEENQTKVLRALNPTMIDRYKKLEDQFRVESLILDDAATLVAYIQNMRQFLSRLAIKFNKVVTGYNFPNIFNAMKQIVRLNETELIIQLIDQMIQMLSSWTQHNFDQENSNTFKIAHNSFINLLDERNNICLDTRLIYSKFSLTKFNRKINSKNNMKLANNYFSISPYVTSFSRITPESIKYVMDRVEPNSVHESLKDILNDLKRTSKEFEELYNENTYSYFLTNDFLEFPALDVVRESPDFRKFCQTTSYNSNFVRSQMVQTMNSISKMFQSIEKLNQTLSECTSIPVLNKKITEKEEMRKEETRLLVAYRQLLFFKYIVKNSNLQLDQQYVMESFFDDDIARWSRCLENDADLTRYFHIMESSYEIVQKELKIEEKNIKTRIEEIKEMMKKLNGEMNPEQDTSVISKLESERQKIKEMEQNIDVSQETIKECIHKAIINYYELSKEFQSSSMTPLQIDTLIQDVNFQNSNKNRNSERIKKQEQIREEKILYIQKQEDSIKLYNDEISKKKEILVHLKESYETKTKHKILAAIENKCASCHKHSNEIIMKCGHMICQECCDIIFNTLQNECPICHLSLCESDIHRIVW